MENNKILNKLEVLYQQTNEKGQKKNLIFVSHLFKSFYPIKKVNIVLSEPNDEQCKEFFCVFSKEKIFVNENKSTIKLFNQMKEQNKIDILPNMNNIALFGEKTDTYCSLEGLFYFHQWIEEKLRLEDVHFKWLLSKEKKVKKRVRKNKFKKEKNPNNITTTFGDLDVLKNLAEKLRKNK